VTREGFLKDKCDPRAKKFKSLSTTDLSSQNKCVFIFKCSAKSRYLDIAPLYTCIHY